MQAPPPLPEPEPSWYRRNWKWFIPVLCVVLLLFEATSVGCVWFFMRLGMKSLGAYTIAVHRAEADARVTAVTGTPLKEGLLVMGSFNVNGASGRAELAIPMSGPRGKGTIYLVAAQSAGEWRFSTLVFQVDPSGERIDLQKGEIITPPTSP